MNKDFNLNLSGLPGWLLVAGLLVSVPCLLFGVLLYVRGTGSLSMVAIGAAGSWLFGNGLASKRAARTPARQQAEDEYAAQMRRLNELQASPPSKEDEGDLKS